MQGYLLQPLIEIQQNIPSNKFYPPRLDTCGRLLLSPLITDKLVNNGLTKKVIVIEAQADQRKSVLVLPFKVRFQDNTKLYVELRYSF